jgi:hypothetical protein
MKKTTTSIIIFILLFYINGYAQSKFITPDISYPDKKIVNHYLDSLEQKGIDTAVVFLTKEKNTEITYLIWIRYNKMNLLKITDTSISEIIMDLKQNFTKRMIPDNIAISNQEDKLRFSPPVNLDKYQVAILKIKSKKFLVEIGDVTNYVLDKRKQEKRKLFFLQLNNDIKEIKESLKIAVLYYRPT